MKGEFIGNYPKWLAPLFRSLDRVIDDYTNWEEEPPYFNNEAACVSLLVVAGARSGYITLSDYRTDKAMRGEPKNGRCDLLIGKKHGKTYLEIEAKWMLLGVRPGIEAIEKKLHCACKDAEQLVGNKHKRAGLLFLFSSLSQRNAQTFNPEQFAKKLATIESNLRWWRYDHKNWEKYKWRDRYYPGFAVLLRNSP